MGVVVVVLGYGFVDGAVVGDVLAAFDGDVVWFWVDGDGVLVVGGFDGGVVGVAVDGGAGLGGDDGVVAVVEVYDGEFAVGWWV